MGYWDPLPSMVSYISPDLGDAVNSLHAGKLFMIICYLCFSSSKFTFSYDSFRNTNKVSHSLDPDQALQYVGPDLGSSVCKDYQQVTLASRFKTLKPLCMN